MGGEAHAAQVGDDDRTIEGANAAATGAHMSPVSPNPCSSTTAGPWPPIRTCRVVPLVAISAVWKPSGNGVTA